MKRHSSLTEKQQLELSEFIRTTNDAKETRRAQVALLLDKAVEMEQITILTGLKRRQIFKYRSVYLKAGLKGLENKRKGKQRSLLIRAQREEIITILITTIPKNQGYESDFWSTPILGDLIQAKYGVFYKTRKPFYLLFEEAKFSFHKPGQVYEKRDEEKVASWKEEIKPKLKEAYEAEETIILCEDEMVLSTQTTFQKIWLKKGDYPKIEVSNTKKNKSVYGFLNLKTGQAHAFIKDWQNMHITVEVLKEIRTIYPSQKILLLWDGAGWHRGSVVQEFIAKDKHIESINFPPYSPEENPQEHVWKAGRSAVTHNKFIPDIEKAANDFIAYINGSSFPYQLLGFGAAS